MSRSCGYWDCSRPTRVGHFLCREHYEDYVDGLIDRCPGCGRFKHALHELCLDCYSGRPVKAPAGARSWRRTVGERRGPYRTEHSRAWERGDAGVEEFYVYILKHLKHSQHHKHLLHHLLLLFYHDYIDIIQHQLDC